MTRPKAKNQTLETILRRVDDLYAEFEHCAKGEVTGPDEDDPVAVMLNRTIRQFLQSRPGVGLVDIRRMLFEVAATVSYVAAKL